MSSSEATSAGVMVDASISGKSDRGMLTDAGVKAGASATNSSSSSTSFSFSESSRYKIEGYRYSTNVQYTYTVRYDAQGPLDWGDKTRTVVVNTSAIIVTTTPITNK